MFQRPIFISIEDYSDSDTFSESEYKSDQESTPGSDGYTDELYQNLEPELSETIYDKFENALWSPEAQLQVQFNTTCLAQLYAYIKACTTISDSIYQKLSRSWPVRPFDVQIVPNYVQHPIYYFELL
jgi:hypothetical protein